MQKDRTDAQTGAILELLLMELILTLTLFYLM